MFLFWANKFNINSMVGMHQMDKRQFNGFWEVRCPHCDEIIDLEILVNMIRSRVPVKT
jgi:hypothetical protein